MEDLEDGGFAGSRTWRLEDLEDLEVGQFGGWRTWRLEDWGFAGWRTWRLENSALGGLCAWRLEVGGFVGGWRIWGLEDLEFQVGDLEVGGFGGLQELETSTVSCVRLIESEFFSVSVVQTDRRIF